MARFNPTTQNAIGSTIGGAAVLLIQHAIEHPPASPPNMSLGPVNGGDIFVFAVVSIALFVSITMYRRAKRQSVRAEIAESAARSAESRATAA